MDYNDLLLLAANTGFADEVRVLLAHNADGDHVDLDGHAVVHLAALSNCGPAIAHLAAAGVNLEAVTPDGRTAFQLAIALDHFSAAEALATAGCNIEMGMKCGLPALHTAVVHGRGVLLAALLEGGAADVHACDEGGRTALVLAAECGNEHALRLLLGHGADVLDLRGMSMQPRARAVVAAWRAALLIEELA